MLKSVKFWLLILLLALIGLTAFFFINKEDKSDSKWQAQSVKPFKNWYQINWQQQAIGWASVELQKNQQLIRIIEEDFIVGRVQAQRMEFRFKRQLNFSAKAPHQLMSFKIESSEPQLTIVKSAHNAKQLLVTENRNGQIKTSVHPAVNYQLSDYLALMAWLEKIETLPKATAEILITKELNNDDFGLHYSRYQKVEQANGVNDQLQVKHQLQNSSDLADPYQSQATLLTFDQNQKLLKKKKPNGMNFVASDGKVSINPEMQRDLYVATGIGVDKPLGAIAQIKQLTLQIPNSSIPEFQSHPALNLASNRLHLVKGYQYPSAFLPKASKAHQRATKIAQKLIRDVDGESSKIKLLTQYVYDFVNYQTLPSSFEVDDILDNRIGDCTEHALLLTEMLNGAGIPARQVSGLIYLGDDKQKFGGHVWVEAYYDGYWHAIDPTWNLTEVTAAHIPLLIGANKTPKILQKATSWRFKLQSKD
ncbi:MAG: transglutaminase domain-containing protein [Gammaproteobacteria bacterium]|nr:transglutaminase domain-containing protein [Gammaproteobacteria bacterium]